MNDEEEVKRVESLKSKKKWGVSFVCTHVHSNFLFEKCTKCEGHSDAFYFPWKKVSSHIQECPHGAEKKRKNIIYIFRK